MKFRCPCGEKEMNIADERLPATGDLRFPCPVCTKIILLDPAQAPSPARFEDPAQAAPAGGMPSVAFPGAASAASTAMASLGASLAPPPPADGYATAPPAASRGEARDGPALEPEMIPHGVKAALVAVTDPAWRRAALGFFRERGYHCLEETDPALAVAKLRINAVDAALVEDLPAWQPVLAEITGRPGLKRRETCLTVTGRAKSLDSYAAFLMGADWVVNQGDVERAVELLGEILARQEASREPWVLAEPA